MSLYRLKGTIIAVLVVVTLGVSRINGQDRQRFERIFRKETAMKRRSARRARFKHVTRLGYSPDTLPAWFFAPQGVYSGVLAVGISDPDMEPARAKAQAILRAKAMALLLDSASVRFYRDCYTQAREVGRYTTLHQRYDTYFRISASGYVQEQQFALLDTHLTRYNEYVVLLRYDPSCKPDTATSGAAYTISALGTTLLIEAAFDNSYDEQAEYEFVAKREGADSSTLARFIFREKGTRFRTISRFNGSEVEYPVYPYAYVSAMQNSLQELPLTSYSGLWSILTRQLLRYLSINAADSSIRIKTLSDSYGSSASSNLIREIASFSARLRINGINFDNDTLRVGIALDRIASDL